MTKKSAFALLILAPILAIFAAGLRIYYSLNMWQYPGPAIVFEVKPGEGFASVNGRLKKQGIIDSAKLFHRYSQVQGLMTKFQAGKFEIKQGMTMLGVVDTLVKGTPIQTKVTLPEGKNLFEIGAEFEESGITKAADFVAAAKDPELMKELGIPAERAEGYLYPDTYQFSPNTPAKDVIKAMVAHFRNKTEGLNLTHQDIILASMIEKETGAAQERPRISGVFHNRLNKRMRLQSDPTTIYGIWERFNGNLRKADLLELTEYNTYKIPALPKGPICNPGLEAIQAALTPEEHSFLYFVSRNDGTHVFTKSYKDHLKAVEDFQKNPSARRGKSWRDLQKN
ncbi:MAG: hypothetical protein COW01_09490 [Bdellovibrionales bacterium CG12_big_fil_rev_8_21_14_0_65_38_15]|nr:MAG: hypothetical protein COW79_09495 [Bdellovibrionales bacterium CG22_combo_CG10-13_8_21_14_all_38_13]PIQ54760.1 MAG: hypothetical protein COW01_09490 [Bdellovibrionales bacterium CG12_big_fil_rev_8_21_14_0_65_38_15]PIR31315.1 MAG: hypothetical protein COV38_01105 [Bdellovibrionales bacterium CG11_big_fil_rev_8_21_14_0_20_38_13]